MEITINGWAFMFTGMLLLVVAMFLDENKWTYDFIMTTAIVSMLISGLGTW